jgi:NNP family nitrate/nitrite transporter-like MFS transporter
MRAFFVATFSFFIAFMAWFSLAPLMTEIKKELKLTKIDVNNANIAAVSASVISRFAIGPLADTWGPRYTMIGLMIAGSIPVLCSAAIHDAHSLAIVRFFIGFLGGTFVCTQAWTSQMFAKEIVGTANGLAGGWGNLGGGVTHIFMVGIYSAFKSGMSNELARRWCYTVPAALCLLCALFSFTLAEDSPKGNFSDLVKHGALVRKSSSKSTGAAASNYNTWLLGLVYAATFGTELVVFNIASTYFHDKYKIEIEKAALIAALFGLMNLITRPFGGILSDILYRAFGSGTTGMRGRLLNIVICLLWEGAFLSIMAKQKNLGVTIFLLVLFAVGGQMGNGAVFAVVPYVQPSATGSVSGLVGAWGNAGAIAWSLLFRFGAKLPEDNFFILGFICMAIAAAMPLVAIRGHNSLFFKARGEPAAVDTF